jgi:hypothetical protein
VVQRATALATLIVQALVALDQLSNGNFGGSTSTVMLRIELYVSGVQRKV